jgi:hypothetical protein
MESSANTARVILSGDESRSSSGVRGSGLGGEREQIRGQRRTSGVDGAHYTQHRRSPVG